MRKIKQLFILLVAVLCMTVCGPVYAAGTYAPIQVSVPVEGSGSYILKAENNAPEASQAEVKGNTAWNITFNEPGTYMYTAYDSRKPDNKRGVEVFITDDSTGKALALKETLIVEENGKKAGQCIFKDETPAKKPAVKGQHPKTGDLPIGRYLLMIAFSGAALLIAFTRKERKDDRS